MRLTHDTVAWPDWRDERAYDYTAHLTRRSWAWEFLRRNPAFQHDLARALRQARCFEAGQALDVIAAACDLSRWGLLFRVLPAP